MLIGLCGPPLSGKRTVADFLLSRLGFIVVPSLSFLLDKPQEGPMCSGDTLSSALPSPFLLSQCWKHNVNVVITRVSPGDPRVYRLLKRPYFLLIYIDAPFMTRFRRAVDAKRFAADSLESFAHRDDSIMYRRQDPSLDTLRTLARLHVVNHYGTFEALNECLLSLDLTDPRRYRPSWDSYFMSLAKLASERSNCMKRRVGCVIARDKRIVATGYNGTPSGVRNCLAGGCERCNGMDKQGVGLDLCLCLHAEENAIIEAGRERCTNGTLYTTLFPCMSCAKKIVQAGVRRIIYDAQYATDTNVSKLLRSGEVIVEAYAVLDTPQEYHNGFAGVDIDTGRSG